MLFKTGLPLEMKLAIFEISEVELIPPLTSISVTSNRQYQWQKSCRQCYIYKINGSRLTLLEVQELDNRNKYGNPRREQLNGILISISYNHYSVKYLLQNIFAQKRSVPESCEKLKT